MDSDDAGDDKTQNRPLPPPAAAKKRLSLADLSRDLFLNSVLKPRIVSCPQAIVTYTIAETPDAAEILTRTFNPEAIDQKIRELLSANPTLNLKQHKPLQEALGITVISCDPTPLQSQSPQPLGQTDTGDVPLSPNLVLPGHLRPQSLYIGGNPGFGKSSLIQNMALHDMRARRGVCVIDPTGDLVHQLIHHVPRDRVDDAIYFDTDAPIPIDFFSYEDEPEREVLIDELVAIFALENAPRAKPLLRKVIGTLLDANQHPSIPDADRATFLDIIRFIQRKDRRETLLSYCPGRKKDWDPFPRESEFESIIYRMIPFTESRTLRTILGCKKPKLNLWDVIQDGKILLVNLKDTETDLFLGSLIAAKIQQAIFRRRIIAESQRIAYYLYIDECQTILKFGEETFDKILTRARKYKLCLTLANQIPKKLPAGIQEALGTIGNLVLFNLDTQDARVFEDRIAPYEIEQLVNLDKFQAIARVGREVQLIPTLRPLGPSPASSAESIRKRTIANYSCDTPQVCANKDDGNRDPATAGTAKRQDIGDGPPPNVPPHGGKT